LPPPTRADLTDVDHFFPHTLGPHEPRVNLDGVWNLVLACQECNRGPAGKFARLPGLPYLERLQTRNTFLIESHHPLRETLMSQTGETRERRREFLQGLFTRSKRLLLHTWTAPMSTPRPSDPSDQTLAYYERNAARYVGDTAGVDMAPLYEPFLALMPAGGRILDVGCGSGRDSLAFLARGYEVLAVDGSAAMVRAAAAAGVSARRLRFQDLAFESEFDGVWACASLLHVPRGEITGVVGRVARALRPGGVCMPRSSGGRGR
jgi:SAM-dependent methyltransferase